MDNKPKIWTDEEPTTLAGKYETDKLALAVTLSLKFELLSLEKGQQTIRYGKPFFPTVFSFNDSEDLQKAVDEYYKGATLVNPSEWYRQLQTIRTRIHELLNS